MNNTRHISPRDSAYCPECRRNPQQERTRNHGERLCSAGHVFTLKESREAFKRDHPEPVNQLKDEWRQHHSVLKKDCASCLQGHAARMETGVREPESEVAVLRAENEELRHRDRLWNSAFGTSQLTHAKARLEAAESKAERLERQVAEAKQVSVDEARLKAIRERVDKATPGPWIHIDDEPVHGDDYNVFSGGPKKMMGGNPIPVATFEWEEDEAFACAAREDIPYLLTLLDP